MLLLVFAHISDYGPVCRVSHTPWSGWPFLLCFLITNSSSEWTVCSISHTPSTGCPFLLFCLIANSSLHWTICLGSHTQLKSEPCLLAPPSLMFSPFLAVLLHHRLRLLHRKQFRRSVSDRSVALATSWSSETSQLGESRTIVPKMRFYPNHVMNSWLGHYRISSA